MGCSVGGSCIEREPGPCASTYHGGLFGSFGHAVGLLCAPTCGALYWRGALADSFYIMAAAELQRFCSKCDEDLHYDHLCAIHPCGHITVGGHTLCRHGDCSTRTGI